MVIKRVVIQILTEVGQCACKLLTGPTYKSSASFKMADAIQELNSSFACFINGH